MREKGVLRLPWESRSDSGRFHYCCHLNKSTSGMTCNLVQSTTSGWIYAFLASVFFVMIIITLYLPAVICLPSLPRVSVGGVRCIALEDPSPAALQSLIAKAFSRPNPASLQDKTRLFFLKPPRIAFSSQLLCLFLVSTCQIVTQLSASSWVWSRWRQSLILPCPVLVHHICVDCATERRSLADTGAYPTQ